jgi:hypothetical protein
MIGRRLPDGPARNDYAPGDYQKITEGPHPDLVGFWYARAPRGHLCRLGQNHTIVEHEDGTITVSPSILINWGQDQWHGYLERGVWREV